ncbi:MAG: hypothetical protein KZQ93_04760 [Candidatus Thiodiazotropha sp. (ex Monitilora ramsayi)]|nr:hypothetical protein [Candidatus Thiodiazotropha sp. (ex Monitilora ramsayi)]
MIRNPLMWLILCLSTHPMQAIALEEIGAEILDTCMSEQQALKGNASAGIRYGLCLGYLKGVADTLNGKAFCIPETGETAIVTQQLKQTYIAYASNHKNKLRRPALQTVVPAFRQAFPCRR